MSISGEARYSAPAHNVLALRLYSGCNSGLITLGPLVTVPAWVAAMVFDAVIFILTLAKAIRVRKYFLSF